MTARGIAALMRPVWAASWHPLSKQLSIAITGHVAASRSSIDISSAFCVSHSMISHFLFASYECIAAQLMCEATQYVIDFLRTYPAFAVLLRSHMLSQIYDYIYSHLFLLKLV